MTAGAGRVSAQPSVWQRLVRRAGPGTVRARVTAVAGLALTAGLAAGPSALAASGSAAVTKPEAASGIAGWTTAGSL